MKLELKTSFLFGLLIGLLLVMLFGKPRRAADKAAKPVEKPAAKPEPARSQTPPASWRNRSGANTYTGKPPKRTVDVEAQKSTDDAEFDEETARLDAEAFAPLNQFLQGRRQKVEPQS